MRRKQSCSALVEEELDVEELVVALWKNKLGVEVREITAQFRDHCNRSRRRGRLRHCCVTVVVGHGVPDMEPE